MKVGFFRTNDDLVYHDEIHGDLFTQATKTVDLLVTKYLKAGIRYQGIQRVETFPVPNRSPARGGAERGHSQGLCAGATIQISVYADKLMIWNPGHLPRRLDRCQAEWASILAAVQPADIANAFFRAG